MIEHLGVFAGYGSDKAIRFLGPHLELLNTIVSPFPITKMVYNAARKGIFLMSHDEICFLELNAELKRGHGKMVIIAMNKTTQLIVQDDSQFLTELYIPENSNKIFLLSETTIFVIQCYHIS